ncbi:MAG TPA: DNA polymerase III subunit alpha [Arenimonas sp.]|uniref:DNA polymerase III subunit alpha n=1 Tax=Arenimonas sp. TaxID=1872635 RepID=UPI002B9F1663|nr:DNA polymerase III subunit alpha [Arenimonas sp.]HMB57181.1 DNA polymerase III subunit alpha [Arenimonas sp.]
MAPTFVHLHTHSEFSLTDSTLRIAELVKRCAELGSPAVAITDTSNLFALVKFFKAAEGAGIKPIAGADVWLAEENQPPARLTLLCQNQTGYLSLSRLITRAYLDGHRGDFVAISNDWLRHEHAGLIAIAGRDSPVGQLLAAGRRDQALALLREWQALFGDRLYLELTRTSRDGEESFNAAALELAAQLRLPVLASNDVRFLDKSDFDAHEARVCIATGRVLDDPKRPREFSAEQYLKSPEEMAALFADLPEALENTVELAKRCNLELSLGTYYLPDFPVPENFTLDSWIRDEAVRGLAGRLEKNPLAPKFERSDYDARLDTELGVISAMGFPGYFLIVADFINWGKRNDIPVGPGRGSGAGSLVAWALGITDLDPMRYDLLFERFLNPERVSMPDFDIDFCMDRRDEVIDYVARKYGRDKVSQIITYGTMAAKAAVRDCGRVLGYPYGFVDSVAKLIPMTLGVSLDDAMGESDAARKDSNLSSSELIARYNSEDDVRDLIDLARKLEDLTRNAGKHAGGVVIAPKPLTEFSPLFAEHVGKGETAKSVVTQFDKDDVEAIGLVKFDFLGLRTLTIIDWAVKAINVRRKVSGEEALDILALPLDDKPTYQLLSKGLTTAVFQFESRGMKDYIRKLEPAYFEDLIALAALFRPGPLGAGMVDDFINRRHGRAEVSYPHPSLEAILKPTYGVIVYQEQVMQIAQVLSGYSLGGADLLRRAMGKKKPEEMAKERVKFEAGAETNGINAKVASSIFDLMEKFADYGFNKSHSAAYALVAYQTAWLKAHYPAEFMAATLSSDMDNTDKVVNFLEDSRAIGLKVLPPDVNSSGYMFQALDAKTIRYGLGAVKGVGRGACEAIADSRQRDGVFRDLLDFCQRVDSSKLNRRVLEAMVQAGALDGLGCNRASLMLQLPEVLKATEQLAREREAGQVSLFGGSSELPEIKLDLPTTSDWSLEQKLLGERETLGHFLSGHPLDPWKDELATLVGYTLGDIEKLWSDKKDRRGEAQVVLAGLVTQVRRRGDSQAFVQIEDTRGRLECAFFSDSFSEYASLLSRDRIIIIEGGLREDAFNGGFSLRARQCWDFRSLCAQQGRRLSLTVDLRKPGTWEKLQQTLTGFRPGGTPLRLDLMTPESRGIIDLNGPNSVRSDAELINALRALPGVSGVSLALHRPWSGER